MRLHALLTAAVAVAVLSLAGCGGGSSEPDDPKTSAASPSRPSNAPTAPYGATLVAGEDDTATLTNVGRKADRYVVMVSPSFLGTAVPAFVELEPGASAEVRYHLEDADGRGGSPVLQAHSTLTGEDTELALD